MPRRYKMSWEGSPAYRWVKMYKGVRYRVTCQELGATIWTQEGSGKLANEWWDRKLAELVPKPDAATRVMTEVVETVPVEKLKEIIERGIAARALMAELPLVEGEPVDRDVVERIIGFTVDDEARRLDHLSQILGRLTPAQVPADRTFKKHAERFLEIIQGEIKPLSNDASLRPKSLPGLAKGGLPGL